MPAVWKEEEKDAGDISVGWALIQRVGPPHRVVELGASGL